MVDMMAISQQYGGYVKSCRYMVRIRPRGSILVQTANRAVTEQLSYLCEAAEMPGRGFMNIDARYHGPNFKIPFQTQYEDTSMTFLCRSASRERQFFDDWMEIINPTHKWNFSYRDDYSAFVDIYQLTDIPDNERPDTGPYTPGNPLATYQWTLHDAYPVVISPQPVTWADDNFQRLTITFTYTKWTRPGLDKAPSAMGNREADFVRGSSSQFNTNRPTLPTPDRL
jgi:hypothetical protein